jgi:hypothetical protein
MLRTDAIERSDVQRPVDEPRELFYRRRILFWNFCLLDLRICGIGAGLIVLAVWTLCRAIW